MTHIKWPNELGPPVPHEPNWQNEAMQQSALLHQALSEKRELEIKLDVVLEALKTTLNILKMHHKMGHHARTVLNELEKTE